MSTDDMNQVFALYNSSMFEDLCEKAGKFLMIKFNCNGDGMKELMDHFGYAFDMIHSENISAKYPMVSTFVDSS
jgi:hypothetical protein